MCDMTTKKHGGKRKGAGRPATGQKETVVVRIDSGLLQAVNDLKNGVTINQVVTTNQDGVDYLAANKKLTKVNDELRAKNIKQGNDIRELETQVRELERVAALNRVILDDFIAKRDGKPLSDNCSYDGNTKGFRIEVEQITGISQANRSKFASKLKSTYAATGITPQKNGRLSSDTERIAVVEWLRDNP